MTQQTLKLIELLNEGKTCNQICSILGITSKQLYIKLTNLKNKGFFFKRQFYSDGSLIYLPMKKNSDIKEIKGNNNQIIFTGHDEENLHVLAISDLHFGNCFQREDLVQEAFEYCIKNDIHIILCCGDIIDGTFSQSPKKIAKPFKQIEYFIKKYPFDKNILTFGVMGDHDITSLRYELHQDFTETVYNYRNDVILSLDNEQIIKVKNDQIGIYHKYADIDPLSSIVFNGHIHTYCCKHKDNVINIVVPSLSDITKTFPEALDIDIEFSNGYITNVFIKQLIFDKEIKCISEVETELPKLKAKIKLPIKYEEYSKERELILEKKIN